MSISLLEIEKKIKDRIWRYAKDHFYTQRVKDSPLIENLNYDGLNNHKRVLICYLTHIYFQKIDLHTIGRTIPFEIFKLVKIFSDYGYCIDIISVNDLQALEIIRSNSYSLIFGFGETFYLMTKLQPEAVSIFYVTENHPEFSYKAEKERLDYFYHRHRKRASIERSGRYYKPDHVAVKYDHLITMGEIEHFTTQYKRVYSIYPTGFLNSDFLFKFKDHRITRKHFLWLGSSAVIHKGLDLLIDIIAQRDDIILHICGLDRNGRQLLIIPQRENIIDYGFVNINSETFLKIVNICSYSILPSCSEGMATSIMTSMLHGLIPVVLRDSGFNRLGEHAIFLDDFKIGYLNNVISKLAEYDPGELSELSEKIQAFASCNFSIEAYEKQMRSIFKEILG
ncbi:MAG: hypothetical protein AB9888_13360 [Bacteroidales bacterium]